ncbi:glycosyltransferase family 2 protein [Candidatus Roizmanbacteria bacterium]|nr:glycosyltransferase family 2 protein [Candidatus Roizmanbacteria bacterium]
MRENKLTAVVLSKNEAKNLAGCLKSIDFCGEVIVVDDFSEDNTVEVAKKHNATVVQRRLAADFAAQRNYGMAKASGDWLLFIDADERVSPDLKKEILRVTAAPSSPANGYFLRRRDYWLGRELKYGETGSARSLGFTRLIKKGKGKWAGRVHEKHGEAGFIYAFLMSFHSFLVRAKLFQHYREASSP